jgi:nitronate monooxygenase
MSMQARLPEWELRGRRLLPIVQGGMGVGVSAHRLAGSVARLGAMGTISSVELRQHHPDLLEQSLGTRDKETIDRLNLVALDREIRAALALSEGHGAIAVNVMKAVSLQAEYVRQSCESGAHAIVMGAGLPLDLPDLTSGFPDVALVPILSEARGVSVVLRKWMRKNRLPDAIVIEHPGFAGGHLGATRLDDVKNPKYDFEPVLAAIFAVFDELGIARERIPLIVAGGVSSHEQVRALLGMGASAVQAGTAFAVCVEGDADPRFKKVLAEAKPEDIVTFMSVAGLPARAVATPWLRKYLSREKALQSHAKADPRRCVPGAQCLAMCGLRDGIATAGQFCISTRLAHALHGDVSKGLFFRGSEPLPFGAMVRPVAELVEYFLTGATPDHSGSTQ